MAQVIKGGAGVAGAGAAPQGMLPKPSHLMQPQPGILHPSPMPPPPAASMTPTAILQHPTPHSMAAAPHAMPMADVTNGAGDEMQAGAAAADATNHNMANTKEKTPMCLVNELARYNKIQHQYTLTDEQGPAHKKTFYVKLKLGEEEYAAAGPSIKKAQHAAAAIALEKTQYKHPPPKPPRKINGPGQWAPQDATEFVGDNPNITPTVDLNALAMKRGEPAVYRPIEPQRAYYAPPNYDFRGMYNQRYHYPRYPRVFYVSLKVGQREFIGEGNTRQSARHNAAAKALKILRTLPLPTDPPQVLQPVVHIEGEGEEEVEEEDGQNGAEMEQGAAAAAMYAENDEDALKSEISLVHEIALKRSLSVNFEVIRESGPPHMRTFVTRCTVGQFVTDGEGNGKKVSKKRAAERMLDQLRTLDPLPPTVQKPKRNTTNKKKNRNLIKVNQSSFALQKADPNYGVGINPISRLIQIQQAKKEKEPVYTLITERGMPRRREFVMQVQVGEHTCTGVGPNKKLAKRNAAEAMLQLLGYSRPSPQPAKPAIKSSDGAGQAGGDKKVTFIDQDGNPSRQVVPGVILMPEGNRAYMGQANGQPYRSNMVSNFSTQTTASIAKELLETGSSPTAEALIKSGTKQASGQTVRPKQQLMYLADVLGFQVQYTDFPKGTNKNEYLSLVSLSTNPPQVSHGAGPTIEASHDIAALTALKALADLGLDSVTDGGKDLDNRMASGDGPHLKKEDMKMANSSDPGNTSVKTEAS